MSVEMATAIDLYNKDHRFAQIAQAATAASMDEHRRRLEREHLERRDVHEVALLAAVLALKRAFEEDAELSRTRMERDHWKAMAEKMIALSPLPPLVLETKS